VGTTLASREDSVVNALLKIRRVLEVFPEEDETSTRTTKSLVTVKIMLKAPMLRKRSVNIRSGGNDVAVFERVVELLSSDETTGMGNICHEPCAFLGRNFPQLRIVPVTGVGWGTTDDKSRFKDLCLSRKSGIVNEISFGSDGIREGLEVNWRCSHFLFGSLSYGILSYQSREKVV
jgi:hypothetical protein